MEVNLFWFCWLHIFRVTYLL